MSQVDYYKLVQAFENLFLTSKKHRIEQNDDGSYFYNPQGLSRDDLIAHFNGTKTIGIFSGQELSKYICFDVDTGKESRKQAQNDVRILVHSLIAEFSLSKDYITVADSGNKGYHVYLFFDNVIPVEYLRAFYHEVLDRTGYSVTQIEFRPTPKQGVKLPLGIHRVTGRRCNFVDPFNEFEPRPYEDIYNIKQLPAKSFKEVLNLKDLYQVQRENYYRKLCEFMEKDEAKVFNGVLNSLDFTSKEIEHAEEYIAKMLRTKTLIYPDTRNKYTLLLSIYLKGQGNEPKETINLINEVMLNSKRSYKGLVKSSESHIKRETKKIVEYVYRTNIVLGGANRDVYLYVEEIRDILALKKPSLMKLYTSMLVHSKRHKAIGVDNFYMAYSTMSDYGNTTQRDTLRKYIDELEQQGRIKVVSRYEIDPIRSEVEGHIISKTNIYEIKKSFDKTSEQKVLIKADTKDLKMENILANAYNVGVISYKEVKNNLTRYQLNKFKQAL